MEIRGFKIAKKNLETGELYDVLLEHMPKRSTKHSAGYDMRAVEDVVIVAHNKKPTLVNTGIKAYMPGDEGGFLYNRSGNPKKLGLVLANGVGVVDADYFENPDNDGAIMFAFYNVSDTDVVIQKGDRIGQLVFQKYYLADDDNADGERVGGFGSTGV